MKAIIKRPDEKLGHFTNMENTLEALQNMVGGYIETIGCGDAVVICNEEGKLMGLPMNFLFDDWDVVVGTVVVVGDDGEGDFTDCPITLDGWEQMLVSWGN